MNFVGGCLLFTNFPFKSENMVVVLGGSWMVIPMSVICCSLHIRCSVFIT